MDASERFAFAAFIQNLRQMELSANEVLLERLSQGDPDYDAFIDWSGDWIAEARGDLRELERIKDDALREISQEEAEGALENLAREFSELQDRLRELPDFVAVIERFEQHRRDANP